MDLNKALIEINDLILSKSISKVTNFKIILGDINIIILFIIHDRIQFYTFN